jgi:hypothetical protein
MIETKVAKITPKFAEEVLEKRNPRNRNVVESTVQSYANDMKNGRWVVTHQGIAFDENDNLVDGQHRLWAVVFSGVAVEMMITTGLPTQEVRGDIVICPQDVMDNGRIRHIGQQMQLSHNIKNGNKVAAACRGIVGIIYSGRMEKRLSASNSLYVYEQYGKDIEAVIAALHNKQSVSHNTAPLAMYHHGEPEKAMDICHQMRTLEGLTAPMRVYLRYLELKHLASASEKTMRAFAKCIKAFHNGESMSTVSDGEQGFQFLTSMYPSLNNKIRNQVKPISGATIKRVIKKK